MTTKPKQENGAVEIANEEDVTMSTSARLADMLAALEIQEEAPTFNGVEAWVASNPGEFLAGEIVGKGEFFDDKYHAGRVLETVIVKEDGTGLEWAVIPYHKSLRMNLLKARPNIGDLIVILYKGEEKSETDTDIFAKKYGVKVERARRERRSSTNASSHPRFAQK